MNKNINCFIVTSKLSQNRREKKEDSSIFKEKNSLNITYCENDSLDKFEEDINSLIGKNRTFSYFVNKRFIPLAISFISVFIILIAFLTISIYEDFLKKIVLETPSSFELKDYISLGFVIFLFLSLLFMPKILDSEGNELKNLINSWFNKDIRKAKRLKLAYSNFDIKSEIHLYNFDLEEQNQWLWTIFVNMILNRFENIYFYVRSDKVQVIQKNLENIGVKNIKIVKNDKIEKNQILMFYYHKKSKFFTLYYNFALQKLLKVKIKRYLHLWNFLNIVEKILLNLKMKII
ncbi:hypothetical protein [Aliarcobacter cryaerophilus]|uniref:hypothetical protein n=1 Tax=Aliarcobacter cryaerophilus TaxID=28198 RepID=UPI003DA5B9A4